MNAKKLEKASKIFADIGVIDKEIIELEKYAAMVADGKVKTTMTLSFEKDKEAEPNKVGFDEGGSLIVEEQNSVSWLVKQYSTFGLGGFIRSSQSEKTGVKENLNQSINEYTTLNILGFLLCEKNQKRTSLITKLQNLGVNI